MNFKLSNFFKDSEKSYATIKIGGKESNTHRLSLPFYIGSSSSCDVIINSESVPPCSKIVFSKFQTLHVYDVRTKTLHNPKTLSNYSLRVMGPVKGDAEAKLGPLNSLKEKLCIEEQWFSSLPPKFQSLMFGFLSQKLRLAAWIGTFFTLLFVLFFIKTSPSNKTEDLSLNPIDIPFRGIFSNGIGSLPDYRKFADGITFRFEYPAQEEVTPVLLTFDVKGLDHYKEISVVVGKEEIFSTEAENSCVFDFCTKSVVIDKTLVSNGFNTIFLKHKPANSDFVVKNVLIDNLKPLALSEQNTVEEWYSRAKRAYDERSITYKNIISAQEQLQKISSLFRKRSIPEAFKARFEFLKSQVDEEFKAMVKELWFEAERDFQLSKYSEAKEKYQSLLEMYPDQESRENRKIVQILETIKELMR